MDIYCQKCGEPWDNYGITYAKGEGDMTREEARLFLKGEGCPSCAFGILCVSCRGAKIKHYSNNCPNCFSTGRVLARAMGTPPSFITHKSPFGYPPNESMVNKAKVWASEQVWEYGSMPNVRRCDAPDMADPTSQVEIHVYRDGKYTEAWAACPVCNRAGETCPKCNGDGLYRADETEEDKAAHGLWSALEASDDPDSILADYL